MTSIKGGRDYTDEEKDEITAYVCAQVSTGRFISRVLNEDATTDLGIKMPTASTFWKWMYVDEGGKERSDKLAQARVRGIEAMIDECGDIADDGSNDYVERKRHGEDVVEFDREHVLRSKLRIETRLKMAAMLNPRKYGARIDLTNSDGKLSPREQVMRGRLRAQEMADREREGGKK